MRAAVRLKELALHHLDERVSLWEPWKELSNEPLVRGGVLPSRNVALLFHLHGRGRGESTSVAPSRRGA